MIEVTVNGFAEKFALQQPRIPRALFEMAERQGMVALRSGSRFIGLSLPGLVEFFDVQAPPVAQGRRPTLDVERVSEQAYRLAAEGSPWGMVGEACGVSKNGALQMAKRWADRMGLPWPIKRVRQAPGGGV
jgi:hypothetical protein